MGPNCLFWATFRDWPTDYSSRSALLLSFCENRFCLSQLIDKGRFSTRNSAQHSELVTHSGGTLLNFLQSVSRKSDLQRSYHFSEDRFCEKHFVRSLKEFHHCVSQLIKKLSSTERGALFRHFCVSKVITTVHAHKSSVIFHFFSKSFQTKQKKLGSTTKDD